MVQYLELVSLVRCIFVKLPTLIVLPSADAQQSSETHLAIDQ